jgi:hypothetical protein
MQITKTFLPSKICTIELPHFYGQIDRGIFFKWLAKIKCINKMEERDDQLYLSVLAADISQRDLLKLIGLFDRYRLSDKEQLRIFINDKNKIFFEDIFLVCKGVRYCSRKDEDMFFHWIKKIKCINAISGRGRELYLHLAKKDLSDQNLRDLLALFNRYNIDMKQLQRFLHEGNKAWFYGNKKGYWHKKVFG